MRRVNYAANKERINAQKRAAYAARRLREQADRGILDDITGGYLPVTEQSIEAVQPFTCRVLDEAGQQALARAHRELLQAAAAHPVGTEVACCYGLDMQPLSKIIISGQQGRVRIPDQDVTDARLEELTREVRAHNNFAQRVPVLEEQIKVANHRITDLENKTA